MKNPLSIEIIIDVKTIRQVLALFLGIHYSDSEIETKFFNRPQKVKMDLEEIELSEQEKLNMCAAFILNIVAADEDK